MSLKAVRVFGVFVSSLNDHPPTEIQVDNDAFLDLSPVNLLYREAELESIGEIWNDLGSKKAKARFR